VRPIITPDQELDATEERALTDDRELLALPVNGLDDLVVCNCRSLADACSIV